MGIRYEIIKGAGRTMWCVRADEDVMRFYSKRECEAWIARAIGEISKSQMRKSNAVRIALSVSLPTSLRALCAFPLRPNWNCSDDHLRSPRGQAWPQTDTKRTARRSRPHSHRSPR